MKISRLHVRGFGKIEDFDITLSNGLNVIYGPNESGKSTLMTFMKAIFYGLKGGRTSKDGIMADIKRYKPWSNADYGGYINFELDKGKSYRIDRSFEGGIVKLYDQSYNEITSSYSDSKDGSGIAEKIIGLNDSLFERTVYIKQLGTRIDNSASKDLIDRISNIRESGSEDISYKKANTALKEALKQQVGTDRSYTRPLDIINKQLEELNKAKVRIQERNKSLVDAMAKKEELALHVSKLSAKVKLFTKLQEFYETKEKLKFHKERKEEASFLNERIKYSQKEINSLDRDKVLLEQNIAENFEKITMLNRELGTDNDNTARSSGEIYKKIKKQKVVNIVFNICIIVSLIAASGVCCLAFIPKLRQMFIMIPAWTQFFVFSELFIAVPTAIALFSIVFRYIGSKQLKKLEEQQSESFVKSKKLKSELDNLQRIDYILKQQLDSINNRISTEKTQYEQLVKRLENHNLGSMQIDIIGFENNIDSLSEIILSLKSDINEDLTCTEKELYEKVFENSSYNECTKVTEIKEFLTAELSHKTIEKATVEANVKKIEVIQENESIDDEILRLTQQKESLEQRGEALSIAIKTLEEASNDVQKKYIPVMNKVFNRTFSELTTQKYSDVRAGENLSIMVSDPKTELIVPASILSSGTIDQMYLALRIAVSETVLKCNESLPFIMDEPFSQYDDERTDNALKCIYDISKKQQVIIFTCKQREVELISSKYPCQIHSLT